MESKALAPERMGHSEPSWATSLSLPRAQHDRMSCLRMEAVRWHLDLDKATIIPTFLSEFSPAKLL